MPENMSPVVVFRLPKDAQVYGHARVTGGVRVTGFPETESHEDAVSENVDSGETNEDAKASQKANE